MDQTLVTYLIVLFIAVVVISQTVLISVAGQDAKKNRLLRSRLRAITHQQKEKGQPSIIRQGYLQTLSPWERFLETTALGEHLGRRLDAAGVKMKAYQFLFWLGVLGACQVAIIKMWTGELLVALASSALLPPLALMYLNARTQKRLALFEEQFVEALDVMKRALLVGHPFVESLKTVAEEMPDPIATEFTKTYAELNHGVDLKVALTNLAERNPTISILAFMSAVVIQKETGGNMAENLDKLAKVIRGRFRLYRKVKTLSAEGRMSAWILALVPLVMFLLLYISNPDYLTPLTDTPNGQKVIAGAVVLMGLGLMWIRRLLRIEA